MTGAIPALCGLSFGLGVLGLVVSWRRSQAARGAPPAPRHQAAASIRTRVPRLALAAAAGLAATAITGWPVALPIAGLAAYGLPVLFSQTSGSVSIAKLEAIATWTEMLQGTLAASAGLGEAIIATSPLTPPAIREPTLRLSARLSSGMHPRDALTHYADDLDDPCADRVICALVLAASSRGQRLGELLVALADSTREEVALRLRVDTSRASVRSSVRTVLVFSLAFAAVLSIVGHRYLEPFGTGSGQLMLLLVGALYTAGLVLMVSLARPPAPIRLIGRQVITPMSR
jgi:tight adherence protein B